MTQKQEYKIIVDLELKNIEIGLLKEFIARCGLQDQFNKFLLSKNNLLDDRDF